VVGAVRTAGSEKCRQLPEPLMNPSAMKPMITASLVAVSAFCTLAVRRTPTQFRMLKPAISTQATTCSPPRRMVKAPEPNT
jgi:hypothetical protein